MEVDLETHQTVRRGEEGLKDISQSSFDLQTKKIIMELICGNLPEALKLVQEDRSKLAK